MTLSDSQDEIRPEDVEAGLRSVAAEGLRPHVRDAHQASVRSRALELGPAGTRRGAAGTRGLDRWVRAAAAVAVLGIVGLVGTGGAAWAARDALPGAPLYGLKIATERAAGAFQRAPEGAVDHLLARAERRLDEVALLLDAGVNGELVADTAAAHESLLDQAAARAAGDPQLEPLVEDATAVAVARLEALLTRDLPTVAAPQARAALQAVIDRLGRRSPAAPPSAPPARQPGDAPGMPGEPPAGRPPAAPPADAPAAPPADAPADPGERAQSPAPAGGDDRPGGPRADDRPGGPPAGDQSRGARDTSEDGRGDPRDGHAPVIP